MAKFMLQAYKYMNANDAMKAQEVVPTMIESSREPKIIREERPKPRFERFERRPDKRLARWEEQQKEQERKFTPLKILVELVLIKIKDDPDLRWTDRMKKAQGKRDRSKFCRFHRDHGHDTSECFDLKEQVEALIKSLARFIAEERPRDEQQPEQRPDRDRQEHGEAIKKIQVIAGGKAGRGESNSARKAHARQLRSSVHTVERPTKTLEGRAINQFHRGGRRWNPATSVDPLVITVVMSNHRVRLVLVDTGSSADIIFTGAFDQLSIEWKQLKHLKMPLVGLTGDKIYLKGHVDLPVTLGEGSKHITKTISFLVVDCALAYNVILGRTSLNKFKAVTSTYHLMLKFPTSKGVGEAQWNQSAAEECYTTSVRRRSISKVLAVDSIEVMDEEERQRGQPWNLS